ncbi:MAG TPA: hypothetical protein VNA20_08940 [Frankiaceae bacterium]|nr:hypothetical protein [Frankiaceae bacterium]
MVTRLVKEAFLTAVPDGGQRTARRNAQAALAVQRDEARERRAAFALLAARSAAPPRRAASG